MLDSNPISELKAIYGMLHSSLLFYKKWRGDLEGAGFVVNPYDPCVANRMVRGKQFTVCWHVDDVKASHSDSGKNLITTVRSSQFCPVHAR